MNFQTATQCVYLDSKYTTIRILKIVTIYSKLLKLKLFVEKIVNT